ncbi:unnamed protein product, partial [Schistosoma curassoni]|uniref:Clathrin_bdg domain-containing protein n=1 Tax=Schistosoma curassoni TaxID=6186 RepID=A0A183KTT3_9TREM
DDGFSDNEISQSLAENAHSTTNTINKSLNIHPKLNVYDPNHTTPNLHSECARKTRVNNNSNLNPFSYKRQSLLRNNNIDLLDQQSDYHSSCKPRSKASLDKSRINNRSSITERFKRSKSRQTIKQCGSNEMKALPTRVLPCSPHNNNNSDNDNDNNNNNNSDGLRTSQSTVESEFVMNDSIEKTYFLSKTTDNNIMNTPSTTDKSKLPIWASVFLSDENHSDLDCLFSDNKHNDESFNLFSNQSFESGIHSNSTLRSSPISLSSPTSSTLPPSSCSLTTSSFLFKAEKNEQDLFINSSKQTTDPSSNRSSTDDNNNSNNSILEDLGLDSVDLDFDSLNELVENNEHIPLDIDFNLTASFNNDNFLDPSDLPSQEWNNSLISNTTDNRSNIPDSLLCNKAHQQKQPQWPENLAAENDTMQEFITNDSYWLNNTQTFSASKGLTMFLSESSVHMFEENFTENVDRMCNE